jgi:hypothetical protein
MVSGIVFSNLAFFNDDFYAAAGAMALTRQGSGVALVEGVFQFPVLCVTDRVHAGAVQNLRAFEVFPLKLRQACAGIRFIGTVGAGNIHVIRGHRALHPESPSLRRIEVVRGKDALAGIRVGGVRMRTLLQPDRFPAQEVRDLILRGPLADVEGGLGCFPRTGENSVLLAMVTPSTFTSKIWALHSPPSHAMGSFLHIAGKTAEEYWG